jgi:prophage antirepressor-like protein
MTTIFESLYENYIIFEKKSIKVIIDDNDKVWFNANELTSALGYIDLKDAIKKHVNKKDKTQFKNINHNSNIKNHPQTTYLSESGMYKLILSSKMPKAKKFSDWITDEVLPSIRKFGYYKIKKEYENEKNNLLEKINYLERQNKLMNIDLKKNKFPDGALVYIIDYSDEDKKLDGIYRLGKTDNMTTRKKIYDTHMLHKKNIIYKYFTDKPIQLENCIRAMLYDYRYKDRKDFFICNLNKIKKAFNNCVKSMKNMVQDGGGNNIKKLEKKINKINKNITNCNKYLEL